MVKCVMSGKWQHPIQNPTSQMKSWAVTCANEEGMIAGGTASMYSVAAMGDGVFEAPINEM